MQQPHAVLLLGPTGCGKTPLGQHLEAHGFRGHRCAHFDFGAELRRAAAAQPAASDLAETQHATILHALRTGALLEDRDFPIAATLLCRFVAERQLGPDDRLILNGLPRHIGQAAALDKLLCIETVLSLEATPEVIHRRISSNSGGDRVGRTDDALPAVTARLNTFRQRTIPLLDHYRARGANILAVPVDEQTTPEAILRRLDGNP